MMSDGVNQGWTYVDHIGSMDAGVTALEFYASRYPHSDAEAWQCRLVRGEIRRARPKGCGPVAPSDVLRAGERLEWHRPPWHEPDAPTRFRVARADEHVLVLDKPAGLAVLPGGGFLERTLLHLARARFGIEVAPVHRIDRGTSGLVLFTRTLRARRALGAEQQAGRIEKIYRARVEGRPDRDAFEINTPICTPRERGVPAHAHASGRSARTSVIVREYDTDSNTSLLDLTLHTGRPHQIRIHLAAIGHPIVGEPVYEVGGVPSEAFAATPRPRMGEIGFRLHAMRLGFTHPALSEQTWVEAPPPDDLSLTPEQSRCCCRC